MELKTLEEVGNDLGIKPSTLRTWISEYRALGDPDKLLELRDPDLDKSLLWVKRTPPIETIHNLERLNLKNSQTVQLLDDLENKGSPSIVKVLENRREYNRKIELQV